MPVPARILLKLTDEDTYKCCQLRNGYLQFTINAYYYTGVQIGLFTEDNLSQDDGSPGDPEYVIKVASQGWIDSKIELYKEGMDNSLQCISSPHVLTNNEWRGFWFATSNGSITFGKENESEPIINWKDTNLKPIVKLGFRVDSHDSSSEAGEERFVEAEVAVDIAMKPPSNAVSWIKCSHGQLPDNALIGGIHDGDPVYVIRSLIQRALTPGKLRQGTAYAEVSWGGKENRMDEYEVLANFDGDWVKCKEDNIPPLALLAGRTEDNHPLFVGRTSYNGCLIVGKVQPNHKALYIPFDGDEMAFKEYEILCHKPPGLSTIPHPLDDKDINKQDVKWIYSCHGRIPRNAFVIGNQNGHSVVLIRIKPFGFWYPGWLCSAEVDPHVFAYDYYKITEEYEVLCDFKGHWEKPANLSILKNALIIDVTESKENMYVGRFWRKGELILGPVRSIQPEGKLVCIVCCDNEIIKEEDFELLCHPNEVASAVKNGLKPPSWDL